MKNRAEKLMRYAREQMKCLIFMMQNRTSPTSFSRSPRMLTFENTALLILNMIKKAVAVEMANFYENFKEIPKKPSRQAFAQAREKISYLAFKDFFDKSCELGLSEDDAKTYKGYRLYAVDGTSFLVGSMSNESIRKHFGESTAVKGQAMCRISGIVDILDQNIVNAAVSGFCTGERALALGQVKELKEYRNTLFLLDRGYRSPELIKEIDGNGQKFLMRPAANIGKVLVKNENGEEVELRRYTFALPSGEPETLLTNLSEQEVSDEELAALYRKRWGIETKYLELKDRLQIDSFSGQSSNAVLQDIYATLYISNLAAFLCAQADDIIADKTAAKNNKYPQKANRSFCISQLRKRFISIFLIDSPDLRLSELDRLVSDLSFQVSYVGKSKSRPRDKRKIKAARSHRYRKSVL
jgi:hypothetical protein